MEASQKSYYFAGPWLDGLILSGGGSLLFLLFLYFWQSTDFQYASALLAPFRYAIEYLTPAYLPASEDSESVGRALLVTFFFYISFLVNYPHYTATYFRLFRNPSQWGAYKRPFHISTAIVLALYAATFVSPVIMGGIILTVFMNWSPYHYTGQNFGVGMIILRRANIRLSPMERRWMYAIFYSPLVFHLIWVNSYLYGTGYNLYAMKVSNFMHLPPSIVLLGKSIAVLGFILLCAFIAYMQWYRKMKLPLGFSIVALVQFVWWWFLYLVVITGPAWANAPAVIAMMLMSLPFFHCAQYLMITTHFESKETPLFGGGLKHALTYYITLVVVGIILFQILFRLHNTVTDVGLLYAEGLFVGLINLHHFMVDGFIWKIRRANVAKNL
ncbi:MAG: hypothetical protein R8M38_01085 [Mariprofundaceae bacterium]